MCGYFYKIVENKKIRISMEEYKSMSGGGGIESNGKLDKNNFSQQIKIHRRTNRTNQRNNNMIELTTFINESRKDPKINIRNIPIPKIMRQKGLRNEPYIFFGYNPSTETYKYVCCNDLRIFNHNNSIILTDNGQINYRKDIRCYKLEDTGKIIELRHNNIKNISLRTLSHLFLFLFNKRKTETYFMSRLYLYLYNIIYDKIIVNNTFKNTINFNFLNGYFDIEQFKKIFINNE